MRTAHLARRTLLVISCGSVGAACGNSADGDDGPAKQSRAGSAGLGAGSASSPGGAANAGGSGSGGISTTGGTSGAGGVSLRGGSGGDGGRADVTAGASGRSAFGGESGSGAQAGGGLGGAGEAGGAPGGPAGRGGQAGLGGAGGTGGGSQECGALAGTARAISFGTLLSADAVMCTARQLAASLSNPSASGWRAKGDQHRNYHFADAEADEPYRLYVPTNWDGNAELPLALFLHGAGSDENNYVDQNNQQLLKLAEQHGYLLVAPLGDSGAYGNFLRLSAPFGQPDEAAKLMAQVTDDSERTNQLSERDVINVLELVLAEYPVDRGSLFLFGHSMGSGGTWYLGGKYAAYWRGLAPMSGPFVQETGYPWNDLRDTFLFVTEGTQTPSLAGSTTLRDWLNTNDFQSEYEEVDADHGGMIPLVLPDVFDFFDRSRAASR